MAQINKLLIKIFQSYGFEILRDAEHSRYILAKKDNVLLAVGYLTADTVPTRKDIRNFVKTTINDGAHRSIFVTVEELSNDLTQILSKQKIEVWDREKVEREIGRAMLGDMSTMLDDAFSEPAGTVEPRRELTGEPQDRHEILIPFTLGEVPTTISGEKSTEIVETGLTIMQPHVGKNEAEALSKKIVRSFRFDLQLIPYYIFDYACDVVEGPKQKKVRNKGTLGINALSNTIEEWPEAFDTVTALDQEYTKLDPSFSMDDAQELIKEAVIAINTREVETIEDKGSAIIIEKKKITPKEDVMEIQTRGTVYMPVWCVEGSNGIITIDATTGKVIKEDIYKDQNVSFL